MNRQKLLLGFVSVWILVSFGCEGRAQESFDIETMFKAIAQAVAEQAPKLKSSDPTEVTKAQETLRELLPVYAATATLVVPAICSAAERNVRFRTLEEIGELSIPGLEKAVDEAIDFHNHLKSAGTWDGTEEEAILSAASIYRARLALMRIRGRAEKTNKLGLAANPWNLADADSEAANHLFHNRWQVLSASSEVSVRLHFPVRSGVLAISVHEPGNTDFGDDIPMWGRTRVEYFYCRLETVGDTAVLHCAATSDLNRTMSIKFSAGELPQKKRTLRVNLETQVPEFQVWGHWLAGQPAEIRRVR